MKTYTSYQNDIPRIINNSLADNVTWATEVINDSLRYLTTKYYFNERSYSTATVAQQQFYNLPPQVKKLINLTVTIGSVVWQPKECPSREFWDALNVTTFYQDFPSYFFVFNGQVGLYPNPSSAGNTITMNYKTRIVDLSMSDVTGSGSGASATGMFATSGATAINSGTTGAFNSWMANQWIRLAPSGTINGANGDNQWYQISSITTTTGAVLKNPYQGASTPSGAAFTIGEVPILPEDYQDLPLYRLGIVYYTTRFPDPVRAQFYQKLWDDGAKALDEEFGSKTTNVVLTDTDQPIANPNLFVRTVS